MDTLGANTSGVDTLGTAVDSWSAWAPGLESPEDWLQWAQNAREPQSDGAPAVSFFPAMYRRRLSRLGKMAAFVAHQCDGNTPESHRLVFASRYGEQQRTANILNGLTRGEPVSPTAFSLSVHNAVAGLYSLVKKNQAPTTSLSAGSNTFASGWLEAVGLLHSQQTPCRSVTLVYYDEPLPAEYADFQSEVTFPLALALQLRLATEDDREAFSLHRREQGTWKTATREPAVWQPLAFIRLLLNKDQQTEGTGSGYHWIWKRHEKP